VREFIRPASIEIPPRLQDISGWDRGFLSKAAVPEYPCLIDQKHIVGELYNFINVPMVVWIDEKGHIVRPAEPWGKRDMVRSLDQKTFQIPAEVVADGQQARRAYVDAIRDWAAKGERSEFALPAEEARRRAAQPSETEVLAAANFRLGQYLFEQRHREDAARYFSEARRLHPESWSYKRQTWELEQPGKASGPDFFAEITGLGERHFYAPIKLKTPAN
jgi:hypothetical protein